MSYPFSPGLIKAIMWKLFLDDYELVDALSPNCPFVERQSLEAPAAASEGVEAFGAKDEGSLQA